MQSKNNLVNNQQNWEEFYRKKFNKKNVLKEYNYYKENILQDTLDQIFKVWKPKRDDIYLEIGCGPCFLGLEIAKRTNVQVIGIDFSPSALKVAKYLFKREKIKNSKFILADITNIPLPNNSVNIVFGGGVIEHFEDVQEIINEIYRILRKGGIAYNTVPLLNIGSLTYRQLWGNIPYIPVIRNIFEFIHIKILKAKHLRFGFEFSFLPSSLISMHKKAGFRKIEVGRFKANLVFEYLPFLLCKKIANYISNSSLLFWPVIYILARK